MWSRQRTLTVPLSFFREDSSMQAKRIFVGPCLSSVFLWTTCAVASGFQVQLPARADDQPQEQGTAKQPVKRVQVDDEPGTAKQPVKRVQVEPGTAKQPVKRVQVDDEPGTAK